MLNGVTLILELNTLGNKALAAFLAASANQVATGFGGHAGTKTELGFAGAFRWLISALAHGNKELGRS